MVLSKDLPLCCGFFSLEEERDVGLVGFVRDLDGVDVDRELASGFVVEPRRELLGVDPTEEERDLDRPFLEDTEEDCDL